MLHVINSINCAVCGGNITGGLQQGTSAFTSGEGNGNGNRGRATCLVS